MKEFIGRTKELSILEDSYGKGKAVLIYGRRRIGKTSLIDEFCRGKDSLMLTCIDGTEKVNLAYFAKAIGRYSGEDIDNFPDTMAFMDSLERVCRDGNVIVIDEYQFLQKASPSIDSFLQIFIDMKLRRSKSMLILCGSAVSMMRSTGSDGSRPLYGRFHTIMRLGPLSLKECIEFHPGMSDIDMMRLYLTVGGVPRYHDDADLPTYREFVKRSCISLPLIADETDFLLKADYPESRTYGSILYAISGGSTNLKGISERTGIKETTCLGMIERLLANDAIGIVNPMLGAPKRPVYFVKDDLTAFDHEVLERTVALRSNSDPDLAYEEMEHRIDTFLGRRFELMCSDYLVRNYSVAEIGKWWMDDPKNDIHEEIDVVARITRKGYAVQVLAECKFMRKSVGFPQYNGLRERAGRLMDFGNVRLVLFSVSGFTEELEDFATDENLILIGPDELFGRKDAPSLWRSHRMVESVRFDGRMPDLRSLPIITDHRQEGSSGRSSSSIPCRA